MHRHLSAGTSWSTHVLVLLGDIWSVMHTILLDHQSVLELQVETWTFMHLRGALILRASSQMQMLSGATCSSFFCMLAYSCCASTRWHVRQRRTKSPCIDTQRPYLAAHSCRWFWETVHTYSDEHKRYAAGCFRWQNNDLTLLLCSACIEITNHSTPAGSCWHLSPAATGCPSTAWGRCTRPLSSIGMAMPGAQPSMQMLALSEGRGHLHPAARPAARFLLGCPQRMLPVLAVTACQRRTPASMPSCSALATRTRQPSSVPWQLPSRTRRCAAPACAVCLWLCSGWRLSKWPSRASALVTICMMQLLRLRGAGVRAAISCRSALAHGSIPMLP
jgi:hypothetical protein